MSRARRAAGRPAAAQTPPARRSRVRAARAPAAPRDRPSHRTAPTSHPTMPASTIAASCACGHGTISSTPATTTAMARRAASGQSVRAIPQTACATIATANTFRPAIQPASTAPSSIRPSANTVISDSRRQRESEPRRQARPAGRRAGSQARSRPGCSPGPGGTGRATPAPRRPLPRASDGARRTPRESTRGARSDHRTTSGRAEGRPRALRAMSPVVDGRARPAGGGSGFGTVVDVGMQRRRGPMALPPCGVPALRWPGNIRSMTDRVIHVLDTRVASHAPERPTHGRPGHGTHRGHARPAAARPAHLGHGSLQLPLHLLHAEGDLRPGLSLPAALRPPDVRGDHAPDAHLHRPRRREGAADGRRAAAAQGPAQADRDAGAAEDARRPGARHRADDQRHRSSRARRGSSPTPG